MELSFREIWTVLHGMGFGALFLLAFGGAFAGLYSLRPDLVTPHGIDERVRRLNIGLWLMATIAWLTVISGTWIVYVWYRAKPPEGADLGAYPKALLISRKSTEPAHRRWTRTIDRLRPIDGRSNGWSRARRSGSTRLSSARRRCGW